MVQASAPRCFPRASHFRGFAVLRGQLESKLGTRFPAMAMELAYKRTFIDVKEEFEDMAGSSSKVRAQSSPPERVRRISFSLEFASEEEGMRSYVGTLSQNFANLTNPRQQGETPTTASGSSPTMSSDSSDAEFAEFADVPGGEGLEHAEHASILAEFPLLPSQGSLGHPEVCRRPCIYFNAGHCENGHACAYCHMEHTEKMPKLDKRQRGIIQRLSRAQLLELVLHFCRNKAKQGGFREEARELLGMMSQESEGARPVAQVVADRDLRNLHKTLARMNVSNLIGLVSYQSANRDGNAMPSPSADLLAASLDRLRLLFLPASA
ncbi:unnamed protein product [Symbiodinium natans]|uniref:C3H1-type domain-containing protein n=1 Tax=Symbiodinium natans TaxID=878477 RepID=A0A812UKI0_9DINO|nr:unnamed protein product [Symbiodinium natans]